MICSASSILTPQETDGTFVFHWLFPVQCYSCHCLDFREQCGQESQACLFVFHSRMTGGERAGKRAAFNIVGCLLFVILYLVLPESMYPYIGMIGGIGVGYSAGYAWQTALIHLVHCRLRPAYSGCRMLLHFVLGQMYSVRLTRWLATRFCRGWQQCLSREENRLVNDTPFFIQTIQ